MQRKERAPSKNAPRVVRHSSVASLLLLLAGFAARVTLGFDVPALQTTPDTKSMESGVVVPYTEGAVSGPTPLERKSAAHALLC